jgi:hypothetical protein
VVWGVLFGSADVRLGGRVGSGTAHGLGLIRGSAPPAAAVHWFGVARATSITSFSGKVLPPGVPGGRNTDLRARPARSPDIHPQVKDPKKV